MYRGSHDVAAVLDVPRAWNSLQSSWPMPPGVQLLLTTGQVVRFKTNGFRFDSPRYEHCLLTAVDRHSAPLMNFERCLDVSWGITKYDNVDDLEISSAHEMPRHCTIITRTRTLAWLDGRFEDNPWER